MLLTFSVRWKNLDSHSSMLFQRIEMILDIAHKEEDMRSRFCALIQICRIYLTFDASYPSGRNRLTNAMIMSFTYASTS